MLKKDFLGLLTTAALVSACSGEIEDESAGARRDPAPDSSDVDGTTDPSDLIVPDDPFPQDDPSCPSAAAVVSASNGWRSIEALQPAFDTLEFELMARPEADNIDALVAVGARDIADFSDAAIVVRFADDGSIDARDGSVYDGDEAFAYESGVWYTIAISADIAARTYDVEVERCGEPSHALITGAAFGPDPGVSDGLTTWAAWSSQSAKLDIATPSWLASGSCAPATCQSLGLECGDPSDGCGGSLICGGCGSGQACASGGVCVDVSPPTSQPPPPSGEPSGPADSCPMSSPLSSACICGGAVYSTGFCCEEGYSFSPCGAKGRYVRAGGGGARDGSDWANAWSGLPSVLERDTVYWLGAGNYGSYTFDDGASGELGITVRKATAQSHGSDTGWNATYGSGQAVFGPLRFNASRYTLDGGEPNGLRTVGQMGSSATVNVGGSHIVLRHVEIDGGLQKSNGKQTAGACNGSDVNGDYVVFDRCEVHNIADDGLGIYADHIKVLHSKIHDLDGCGTDGGCGSCYNGHSDGLEISGVTDLEVVGNMVYDVRSNAALFMDDWSGTAVYDLVVYNNVFYAPDSGFAVYLQKLHGAKVHNNIIWGKTQGSRYGGLSMGQSVTDLQMFNNIILNINYSHMSATYDPNHHGLDYNLFGMINSGEYSANSDDLVGDPQFAGIPMSSNAGEHKGSNLTLEDFVPAASQAIDTGTAPGGMPAYDITGEERPKGGAWDRGPFEASP